MCTVSWLRQSDGYVLLCNRDEHRSRLPASGPRIQRIRGAWAIAPLDGNHGGSWVGVNQFGLTLCLLNRYGESTAATRGFVSRGILIKDLLDSRSVEHVSERMRQIELDWFQPFTLLALSVTEPERLFEWTGNELQVNDKPQSLMPLTSSSIETPAIISERRKLFAEMVSSSGKIDTDLLERFHRSHEPERGPGSICMHRDDAATVSLSIVTVDRERAKFSYQPGSPCEMNRVDEVFIQRSDVIEQVAGL